jgi:hypothetical protein
LHVKVTVTRKIKIKKMKTNLALVSQTLPGSQTQRGLEIFEENPAENIKILLDFRG